MQLPAEWITHNTVNFQPPAARTFDLASYSKVNQGGPRAEQVTELAVKAPCQLPPNMTVVCMLYLRQSMVQMQAESSASCPCHSVNWQHSQLPACSLSCVS
jgi:hypothetical protein